MVALPGIDRNPGGHSAAGSRYCPMTVPVTATQQMARIKHHTFVCWLARLFGCCVDVDDVMAASASAAVSAVDAGDRGDVVESGDAADEMMEALTGGSGRYSAK